jgi:hypothetical protein
MSELIDSFITYETTKDEKLAPMIIRAILIGMRSYLAYYDIDIIPSKFKRKVKVPKIGREDEESIDVEDVRKILLS